MRDKKADAMNVKIMLDTAGWKIVEDMIRSKSEKAKMILVRSNFESLKDVVRQQTIAKCYDTLLDEIKALTKEE